MEKVLDKLDRLEKSLNTKYNVMLGMTAFLGIVIVLGSILIGPM